MPKKKVWTIWLLRLCINKDGFLCHHRCLAALAKCANKRMRSCCVEDGGGGEGGKKKAHRRVRKVDIFDTNDR